LDERNELFRKYKYYYPTVRPAEPQNRVANTNGSFFALNGNLQIRSTLPSTNEKSYTCSYTYTWNLFKEHLYLDFFLIINFNDDRLILRELKYRFQIPPEFRPWVPNISTIPNYPFQISNFLDPRNGEIIMLNK
uniref:Neur_chan_LBD domain-containing protein n=1 Tax=Dracunculus medinensis TaxID=318479 RepID=A0A0N4U2L4_DRAME